MQNGGETAVLRATGGGEKGHLLGLLQVCEVIGYPFCLSRRCFPAFSLAKRKGFGQKRIFGRMRRAFRRGRMKVFSLRLSPHWRKVWRSMKERVCDRGATVQIANLVRNSPSGARPSRGGSPPRRLPPCTRASRRGRMKVFSLRLSPHWRKVWRSMKERVCDRGATVRARTGFATPHSGARRKWNGVPVCVAPAGVVFRLICGGLRGKRVLCALY